MSRGTAVQLNGRNGLLGAIGGAVDRARQHLLPGAGFAGEEYGQRRRRDAAGDADRLGHLLRGPDAVGIAVEGVGRPECRALLLVAAILIERDRGGQQLPDCGEGAVGVDRGLGLDDELPGFVAMPADRQDLDALGRRLYRAPGVAFMSSRADR